MFTTNFKWEQPSRIEQKKAKRAAEDRAQQDCYRAVDRRDQGRCRVCGRACSPTAIAMVDRAERHHLVYRSQGGAHESRNVITLCLACHRAVHDCRVRVEGDADHRDPLTGKLNGVSVSRLTECGWQIEKRV